MYGNSTVRRLVKSVQLPLSGARSQGQAVGLSHSEKKNKLPTPDLRHVPFDRWSGAVKASAPTEHSVVLPRLRSTFGEGPALKG